MAYFEQGTFSGLECHTLLADLQLPFQDPLWCLAQCWPVYDFLKCNPFSSGVSRSSKNDAKYFRMRYLNYLWSWHSKEIGLEFFSFEIFSSDFRSAAIFICCNIEIFVNNLNELDSWSKQACTADSKYFTCLVKMLLEPWAIPFLREWIFSSSCYSINDFCFLL